MSSAIYPTAVHSNGVTKACFKNTRFVSRDGIDSRPEPPNLSEFHVIAIIRKSLNAQSLRLPPKLHCVNHESLGQVAQLVERSPEKAGVGGSIPSLATTILKDLGDFTAKTPTHNSTHSSLHQLRCDADRRQESSLRGPRFIGVLLRVEIERRLNLAVTQDRLYGLRFHLRLVHQPVG
jgi:hypothetical protein